MEKAINSTRRTFVYLIFIVFSILYLAFVIESINNYETAKDKLGFFTYVLFALSGISYIASVVSLLIPSYSRRVINSITPIQEKVLEESVTEIEVNGKIIRSKETILEKKDSKKRQITLFALFHIILVVTGLLSVIPLVVIVSL